MRLAKCVMPELLAVAVVGGFVGVWGLGYVPIDWYIVFFLQLWSWDGDFLGWFVDEKFEC